MNIKKPRKILNLRALTLERTDFLQSNFALVKMVLLGSFIAFIVLSAYAFYKIVTVPNPDAYTFNGQDRAKVIRLNLPKLSNEAVMRWASQAVSDIYSFNFLNIDKHTEEIRSYFTEAGYEEFMESADPLINDAKIKKLIYQANSCDVVSIQDTFKVNTKDGTNTLWLLQIPLIIEIEGASGKEEITLIRYVVTVTVEGGNNVRQDKSIALVSINMRRGDDTFCKLPR